MPRKNTKATSQDEAWPMLCWLFVGYEQTAHATVFSAEANPASKNTELQLKLAENLLAAAKASKDALESWLGTPGSAKVNKFINDMIMFMTTGIYIAMEWQKVVNESQKRRESDKSIDDSWLATFASYVLTSYSKNILKERKRVTSLQLKWMTERMRLLSRGEKLFLRRQAITSELLKREVISSMPSDADLYRMEDPPRI
jgi:hypothetical protein